MDLDEDNKPTKSKIVSFLVKLTNLYSLLSQLSVTKQEEPLVKLSLI